MMYEKRRFQTVVDQAEIHRMARSKDSKERKTAVKLLYKTFPFLADKKQGCIDLHRLIQDKENHVRREAAKSVGLAFSYIPSWNPPSPDSP